MLLANGLQEEYEYRPQNTAVVVGENAKARFGCKATDGSLQWSESTETTTRKLTFREELFPGVQNEGYGLLKDEGAFNLTVPANTIERAGQFNCKDSYALLVVLGMYLLFCSSFQMA